MSDGLAGVTAADTVLSHSDSESARLWLRGRPIDQPGQFAVARLNELRGELLRRKRAVEHCLEWPSLVRAGDQDQFLFKIVQSYRDHV